MSDTHLEQEVPQNYYPPHILKHIAQMEEAKNARGGPYSNSKSPSGRKSLLIERKIVSMYSPELTPAITASDGSQQSSNSPFFDFLKLNGNRGKGKSFHVTSITAIQCIWKLAASCGASVFI
jgi:hypothetical protein